MKVTVDLSGVAVARERMRAAVLSAVNQEAEAVRAAALPLIPVEVGTLKGSALVSPAVRTGEVVRAEIAVGGAATPYAEVQHEDETLNHTGTHYSSRLRRMYTRTGQAKFLEEPLLEAAPSLRDRLQARVAAALGGA